MFEFNSNCKALSWKRLKYNLYSGNPYILLVVCFNDPQSTSKAFLASLVARAREVAGSDSLVVVQMITPFLTAAARLTGFPGNATAALGWVELHVISDFSFERGDKYV